MGRLVADAGKRDWDELTAEYGAMLMEGLSVMGMRGKGNMTHPKIRDESCFTQPVSEKYSAGLTPDSRPPPQNQPCITLASSGTKDL
jgi:hypothetical protein